MLQPNWEDVRHNRACKVASYRAGLRETHGDGLRTDLEDYSKAIIWAFKRGRRDLVREIASWVPLADFDGDTEARQKFITDAGNGDVPVTTLAAAMIWYHALDSGGKDKSTDERPKDTRRHMSSYRGVGLHRGKWRAGVCFGGKYRHVGSYETQAEAAKAYDLAAIRYFGPNATTNASLGLLKDAA